MNSQRVLGIAAALALSASVALPALGQQASRTLKMQSSWPASSNAHSASSLTAWTRSPAGN
jgi:hypothetical protein